MLLIVGITVDRVNDSKTLRAYKLLQQENHTLVVANNKLINDVARVEQLVRDASTLTAESRDAAVGTLRELRDALRRASNNDLDPRIAEALATIGRIEQYLCGGTCD